MAVEPLAPSPGDATKLRAGIDSLDDVGKHRTVNTQNKPNEEGINHEKDGEDTKDLTLADPSVKVETGSGNEGKSLNLLIDMFREPTALTR